MAVEKVIKLKVENGEAILNVQELNKALSDTNKQTDGLNATMANATEAIDKYTGGAASGFKALVGGVKSFVVGMKTVKGGTYIHWHRCFCGGAWLFVRLLHADLQRCG